MKDKRLEQQIQHSLNAELSGLNTTSWQRDQFFENATGGTKVKRKISVAFILVAVLLLITVTALAVVVARPAILNWLLGYGDANPVLEQSTQNIIAENRADHITARINGIVYDGQQFAFSYELENDQPDQPAMIVVDSTALVNGQTLDLAVSMDDPKLVPDPRQDILPVRRNPTDGGGWSQPMLQELNGDVSCEITFIVYRPIKGFAVISDPEGGIYHPDAYDEEVQAEIQDSWNTLRSFGNTIIVDPIENDPESWCRDGYTVIDSSGIILGSEWDDTTLYNMRETARIPVTFTFSTSTAVAYDFSDLEDIELTDCTLRIHQLRFSPLKTVVDISLIPRENSQEAAQKLVERYGTLYLLDEKGEQLDYAEMEYEFSPSPWATEHWHDNGCWACTYCIELPGLQSWPENISLATDQGEVLRINLDR